MYSISRFGPVPSPFAAFTLLIFGLFLSTPLLGQCRNSTMSEYDRIGVLQAKAFVGERIKVQVRPTPSGKDRIAIYKQSVGRDSRSRIRVDTYFFSRVDDGETRRQLEADNLNVTVPEKGALHSIGLMDCNTNRTIEINPDRRTEQITTLLAPTAAQPPVLPYGIELFQQLANVRNQDLGFAEIAGVRVHGFKLVMPKPKGEPARPDHEAERWISQEWALTLKETYRRPESNSLDCMQVLVLRPEEPDPTSFELPLGYTEIETVHLSDSKGTSPTEPTVP